MKCKKYICAAVIFFLFGQLTAYAQSSGQTTADITFEPGTLALIEMSSFTFGAQAILATADSYLAQNPTVSLDVHDLRGSGEGWEVLALASTFVSGGYPSLPGASLTFVAGSAVSTQPSGNAPSIHSDVILDCDGGASVPIATAGPGEGLGAWSLQWNGADGGNANVRLNVPGGVATAGAHTATITWMFAIGP